MIWPWAIAQPLSAADVLVLDLYTEKVSDAVWRLERGKLLTAIAQGQNISVLQELLQARTGNPLPETVKQFLADIAARSNSLKDKGTARIIECADAALAVLIANDSRTKPYCMLAGERCLVVPTASETKFRNGVMKLGYSLPK